MSRDEFQTQLSAANPQWKAFMDELEATGRRPRTNPDGDVRAIPLCGVLILMAYDRSCWKVSTMTSSSSQIVPHVVLRIDTTISCVVWQGHGVPADCLSTQQKPEVIFFGESISPEVRDRS